MLDDKEIKGRAEFVTMDQVAGILPNLAKSLVDNPDAVIAITTEGKPALALISWESWLDTEDLAAKMESLELMLDPEARAALLAAKSNPAGADTIPGDELIEKLVAEGLLNPADL